MGTTELSMRTTPPWVHALIISGTIAPFLILQALVEVNVGGALPWVLGVAGVGAFVVPRMAFQRLRHRLPVTTIEVAEYRRTTPNLTMLLPALLIPLLGLTLREMEELIALLLFTALAVAVVTRASFVADQPAFLIFGRHVYEVRFPDGGWVWVISHGPPNPGELPVVQLGPELFVHGE